MIHKAIATLTCTVVLVFAGTANADSWYENFTGGTHYAWAFTPNGSFSPFYFGDYMTLSNAFVPFPPPGHYELPPAGASIVVGEVQGAANQFDNGTVRALLNPGGAADPTYQYTDDWLGVVIRSDAGTGTGYTAVLDLDDGAGNSNLYLFRSDGDPTNPVPLGADPGLTLSSTTAYWLSLRAWDDQLVAELYDTGGGLLASVSATDSTYLAPGYGGVVSAYDSTPPDPMWTSFDNVSATFGIPEPSTLVLLGLGGLGLLGLARRRRKRAS